MAYGKDYPFRKDDGDPKGGAARQDNSMAEQKKGHLEDLEGQLLGGLEDDLGQLLSHESQDEGYSAADRGSKEKASDRSQDESYSAADRGSKEKASDGSQDAVRDELDEFLKEPPSQDSEAGDLERSLAQVPKKVRLESLKKKSPLPLVAGLILVILAVVAVFFLMQQQKAAKMASTRIITFSLEPTDAEVMLDGKKVTPGARKDGSKELPGLEPGIHSIVFTKEGYTDNAMEKVEVYADKPAALGKIVLSKLPPNSIVVKVEPQDVAVYLNGDPAKFEKLGSGLIKIGNVQPGSWLLKVEKKDYESWIKADVEVKKDMCAKLDPIVLKEKKWKPVEIDVAPNTVDVYFDGKRITTTLNRENILVTEPVEPGRYRVQITAEGHENWVKNDTEVFGDITTTIGPIRNLKLSGGKIIVEAPEKSEFSIDGKRVVATARSDRRMEIGNLKPGSHTLKITQSGFEDLTWDKLIILKDRPIEINEVAWKANTIMLSTDPGEVEIYIDGVLKGKTPQAAGRTLLIKDVKPGKHAIRAAREGYLSWEDTEAEVYEKKPTIVPKIVLSRSAAMKVSGKPDGAEILIEGREKSEQAPCTIKDLPAGDISVTVKKEGFADKTEKVTLKPQEETEYEYKLEKASGKKGGKKKDDKKKK
jgi:hypothetical protein